MESGWKKITTLEDRLPDPLRRTSKSILWTTVGSIHVSSYISSLSWCSSYSNYKIQRQWRSPYIPHHQEYPHNSQQTWTSPEFSTPLATNPSIPFQVPSSNRSRWLHINCTWYDEDKCKRDFRCRWRYRGGVWLWSKRKSSWGQLGRYKDFPLLKLTCVKARFLFFCSARWHQGDLLIGHVYLACLKWLAKSLIMLQTSWFIVTMHCTCHWTPPSQLCQNHHACICGHEFHDIHFLVEQTTQHQ